MGKSALATNIAYNVAQHIFKDKKNHQWLFFH